MNLKDAADVAEHLATAIGILVGGAWVLYQYVIRRSGQTGLSIGIEGTVSGFSQDRRLLFVDVSLKNTGNARLDASVASSEALANEFEGSIRFAGSLQLRRIRQPPAGVPTHIDWWEEGPGTLAAPLSEVDLFAEYTDADGVAEFFMEPGEEYHLGNAFVVEPAVYLAKAVFVGQRRAEYWSRIVQIRVE